MKLDIDETVCKKHGLTIKQVLLLYAIKLSGDFNKTRQVLYDKSLLDHTFTGIEITEKGSKLLDTILTDSTEIIDYENWITELAKDFINTFPQGKVPGTAYYYRCNIKEVSQKFKKFFEKHSEYKPSQEIRDRIIEAAKRYNLDMDKDPRYRVTAKYFITKLKPVVDEEGIVHNEENSLLATYLENENQDISTEDWTLNFKN